MLRKMANGFCMSLADSVPGVSGGTVAFIMGFYDNFIGSIHDLTFESFDKKKKAFIYLCKLGIGWVIGMSLSVFILSSLFETQIYSISSLFIGFIVGSIPLILLEERENLDLKGLPFLFLGCFIVVLITWLNGHFMAHSMNLSQLSFSLGVRLFLIGTIAISAMFLPGISGSTLLLIFGAYIPILSAIKDVLTLHFGYIPCLFVFGCGVLFGAATIVKGIKLCLESYRPLQYWE